MELAVGAKHLLADVSTAWDIHGQEYLVLVVKGSWRIPGPGQRPQPIPAQPLAYADIFLGEPGLSPMLYGEDFSRFKPFCDVLFDASAHSAQPVQELQAGWQVGNLRKVLRVVGPRHWQDAGRSLSASATFSSMPLHYGLAFGGTRAYRQQQQELVESLLTNPAGIGWAGPHTRQQLQHQPAPCLEALDDPLRQGDGTHQPCAFSALARHWLPRRAWAGTYDERWQKEIFPFLPEDFDERFYQSAPVDQQMPWPQGGEMVSLWNMMRGRPQVQFHLPDFQHMQARILRTDYSEEMPLLRVDTLYFEPDQERFSAVWRGQVKIRRKIQEFDSIAIGAVNSAWWQQKLQGGGACGDCDQEDEA